MRDLTVEDRVQYIRDLFAPEDEILKEIRERTIASNIPIQIGAEEGKFLQFIIKTANIKSIVEIGTLAGYSTIWMARALADGGEIFTIERNDERHAMATESFEKVEKETSKKIHLLHGCAHEKLKELSNKKNNSQTHENKEKYDMIFIDADKISYTKYLDWAEKNIRPGGIIVADNTYLFEAVYMDNPPEGISPTALRVMREFNKRLSDPKKYTGIMIPTKEGMTIAMVNSR